MIASDWAEVLCSHREVQGQESCGGFETGSCSVLGFGRRLWQYLLSGVVNDWIYLEIYVDLLSRNKSSCKIYLEKIYINCSYS